MFGIAAETLADCKVFDVAVWSDLYKDAHGFRPRSSLANYSAAELDSLWEFTCAAVERAIEHEKECEARALEALKAQIQETIALGAGDEKTAMRWILDADGVNTTDLQYGASYLCWHFGIAYSESEWIGKLAEVN